MKNLIQNVKPLFTKLKNGEQLTADERKQLVEFYLEVASVTRYAISRLASDESEAASDVLSAFGVK